jgi:adenylate cyclase
MTAAALVCGSCGTELPPNSKFCNECGAAVATATTPAEYKQVTVLFADVVRSMDIAAALDAERFREIMTELADRSAAVVQRYGGTVEFTGDGVMALFGAPVALEDHAFRACLASLAIQEETDRLAVEVQRRDDVALRLRVGLNSGRVIAGEIGSGSLGYRAIGEQVGFAQRMESVAPPGGVMLSESTALLVEHAVMLGEPEWVRIKGRDEPVRARRLVAIGPRDGLVGRAEANLFGRRWEMAALDAMVDRAIGGRGGVVNVVGPPGIGKSRTAREAAALAARRGVEVLWTFCESHARDISFQVVARLLRASTGVADLDGQAARTRVREQVPDADPQDLLLLDDLLGIADPEVPLPQIDPDARRRRLTALINTASLARTAPALFLIEDAHWIDEVSESLLADFLTVIPRTPSMVLITSRPEYEGALTRVHGAQTMALAPLGDSDTAALLCELLGSHPSVGELALIIAERAAGNPFFAEEMVRELVQRGVLAGEPGGYVCRADVAEVSVPATVQAAIEARIDRLDPKAKRTLSAAAVVGSRFGLDLLDVLDVEPVVAQLLVAKLIDQVRFTRQPEYVFHHPLIRAVAYEAQLKSDRAELHRRVAAAIESRDPAAAEENAALIAEHLEAAGDLHAAYGWHMRAAAWAQSRDVRAVYTSWQRARDVADRLAVDEPDRSAMRTAPRMLICGSSWRIGISLDEAGFDELRELCTSGGDDLSLARGMAGMLMTLLFHNKFCDAAAVASECARLIETLEPALVLDFILAASNGKLQAGEVNEGLRLAQLAIDTSSGDPTKPSAILRVPLALALAFRGMNRLCLGSPGFRDDLDEAVAIARAAEDTTNYASTLFWKYGVPVLNGAVLPDQMAIQETAELLERAERFGDDYAADRARITRGLILVTQPGQRAAGLELLNAFRETCLGHDLSMWWRRFVDTDVAKEKARTGEFDTAIALARDAVDFRFSSGDMTTRGPAVTVLVESLLKRGADGDISEAAAAIERLAAVPIDPGFVLHELPLLRLRALLARAHGDEAGYQDFADRYRTMANDLGFEGHMAMAEAMT